MYKKIGINQIKLEYLNTKCLILITKFSRILYKDNGMIIDLKNKNIMQQIVRHAKLTDNNELLDIYAELKREIKIALEPIEREQTAQNFSASINKRNRNLSNKLLN